MSPPRTADYDVIVAGGGMAGTAAAHREQFRVSLAVGATSARGWQDG